MNVNNASRLGMHLQRLYRLDEYDIAVHAIRSAEMGYPDDEVAETVSSRKIMTAGEYLTSRGLWYLCKDVN